ncbi:unnamed protein product [Lepidochelys kempii]
MQTLDRELLQALTTEPQPTAFRTDSRLPRGPGEETMPARPVPPGGTLEHRRGRKGRKQARGLRLFSKHCGPMVHWKGNSSHMLPEVKPAIGGGGGGDDDDRSLGMQRALSGATALLLEKWREQWLKMNDSVLEKQKAWSSQTCSWVVPSVTPFQVIVPSSLHHSGLFCVTEEPTGSISILQ